MLSRKSFESWRHLPRPSFMKQVRLWSVSEVPSQCQISNNDVASMSDEATDCQNSKHLIYLWRIDPLTSRWSNEGIILLLSRTSINTFKNNFWANEIQLCGNHYSWCLSILCYSNFLYCEEIVFIAAEDVDGGYITSKRPTSATSRRQNH